MFLLLFTYGLLVFSVTQKSPTADEQNHLARGLAYLKTGDLRLSQEHPPGVNAWEAWPLLLDPHIRLPLEGQSWADAEWYGFADQLLWRVNDHPQAMIFATRVPVMWLTLILAALVYRWARDLGGRWAGLSALALLVLDPNVLAHGRLATTDMGVTCSAVAAMYALWRALRGGNWGRWIVAGAALGAALLSKFSALSLVPLALIILRLDLTGVRRPVGSKPARSSATRWVLRLLALYGAAAAVVWAGYAFTWGPIAALNGRAGPAPAYWAGVQAVLQRTEAGSPAFLMGHVSREGWWYYFPVAFALKTPLPTVLVLAMALGVWAKSEIGQSRNWGNRQMGKSETADPTPPNHGPHGTWGTTQPHPSFRLCLVLPPLAFWMLAVAGSFNIGYRHILPSLPFLYVLAGWGIGGISKCANAQTRNRVAARLTPPLASLHVPRFADLPILLFALCYSWLAIDTLSLAPHYLAYFNQIAGGPDGGYRFLVDSNLDWGQDLPGLKRYVEREGIERIYLSWFGAAHPEAYGFPFHPLPGFWRFGGGAPAYGFNPYAPAPGIYAISATNLQGVKLADRDLYAWFRERTPDAQVGHSILIYRVTGEEMNEEAVVLGVPLKQLAAEERALLRRVTSVRQYDPWTGVIVPSGARTAWYITPQPPGWGEVVRQGPGYVIVRGSPPPASLSEDRASFSGLVTPLSYRLEEAAQDGTLTVTTQWQVEQAPHRAAVSFAHLLDAEGRFVSGWDGVTAPATCWQEGDWIEQRYEIALPEGLKAGNYHVEVGWYDADTGERWAYVVGGERVGDRWLLPGEWKVRT